MSKSHDLKDQRFGRLVAKQRCLEKKTKDARWECVCDCGNTIVVYALSLKSGNTKSCGCLRKEEAKVSSMTHGFSYVPEYRVWQGIKERCYNKNHQYYPEYGGCGIVMSDEWKDDFVAFYKDMGSRPTPDHTIDRKYNTKGYSKDNCRWVTRIEQANNTKRNIHYTYNGISRTLAGWCRELGLNYDNVYYQIRNGSTFDEVVDRYMKKP